MKIMMIMKKMHMNKIVQNKSMNKKGNYSNNKIQKKKIIMNKKDNNIKLVKLNKNRT